MSEYLALLIVKPHAVRTGKDGVIRQILENLSDKKLLSQLNIGEHVSEIQKLKIKFHKKLDLSLPVYKDILVSVYSSQNFSNNWLTALLEVITGPVVVYKIIALEKDFTNHEEFLNTIRVLKGRANETGEEEVRGYGIRGFLMPSLPYANFRDSKVKTNSETITYKEYWQKFHTRIENFIHTTDSVEETTALLTAL